MRELTVAARKAAELSLSVSRLTEELDYLLDEIGRTALELRELASDLEHLTFEDPDAHCGRGGRLEALVRR